MIQKRISEAEYIRSKTPGLISKEKGLKRTLVKIWEKKIQINQTSSTSKFIFCNTSSSIA